MLFIWISICEDAYSLVQNLDLFSEGRGVLQFKTGLMSVIKRKCRGNHIKHISHIDYMGKFKSLNNSQ